MRDLATPSSDPVAAAATTAQSPLHAALEEQFSGAVQEERGKRIAFLRPIAAQGREPLSFFRSIGILAMLGHVVLILLAGICIAGAILINDPKSPRWMFVVIALVMLFPLGQAIFQKMKFRGPYLVLNKDGLMIGPLGVQIPWTDIADVSTRTVYVNFIRVGAQMLITIDPQEPLPRGRMFSGIKRVSKQNLLIMSVPRAGKKPAKEFAETVFAYWHGGLARKELADLRVTPEEFSSAAANGPA